MSVKYNSYLKDVVKSIEKSMGKALHDSGGKLAGKVSSVAPVDTGELRDSVDYDVDNDKLELMIGAQAKHAPAIELGTSKAKAQPFLEVTVKNNIKDIVESIERNLPE